MIVLLSMACVEPPLLDRVAAAYGETVVGQSEMAIGLFVSVAAVIVEPCAAENIDAYVLTGQGYRAFRVTTPAVTIEESGGRTYEYGTVAFGGDVGPLTLTSDAARRSWSAKFEGAEGTFVGTYVLDECTVAEDGTATEGGVAATGSYTLGDGMEQELAVTGGDAASLIWAPTTAAVPTGGQVTWHITDDKLELALADASTIEPVERAWPGVADGGTWEADVDLLLP